MASIQKRPDGRYRARYRDPTGKETAKHFEHRNKAQAWLDEKCGDLARGDYQDPAAGKIRLREWAPRWLDTVRGTLKPSTVESYESLLRSRVLPRFGGQPLSAIRPSDVQEWLGVMTTEGLSASRVRKCSIVLKMVMDAAVRDNLIRRNPVVGVKGPKIERHEAPYFAPDVVDAIGDAMPSDEYRLLVRVLGIGGLRFGEAAALARDRIDVIGRRIIVKESVTEVAGTLVRTATKNYQVRRVPIPPTLASDLRAHLEANVGPGADSPVFHSPTGSELRYRAFHGRVWLPALENLHLPVVGLHVLRHSAAARMIQAGGTPKTVQTILGHRSAAFTLTVYGHLFDTDLDDFAAKLETPADSARTDRSLRIVGATE